MSMKVSTVFSVFCFLFLYVLSFGRSFAQENSFELYPLKPGDTAVDFSRVMKDKGCNIINHNFFTKPLKDGGFWYFMSGAECFPKSPADVEDYLVLQSSPASGSKISMISLSKVFSGEKAPLLKGFLNKITQKMQEPTGRIDIGQKGEFFLYWAKDATYSPEKFKDNCILTARYFQDPKFLIEPSCGLYQAYRILPWKNKETNKTYVRRYTVWVMDAPLANRLDQQDRIAQKLDH